MVTLSRNFKEALALGKILLTLPTLMGNLFWAKWDEMDEELFFPTHITFIRFFNQLRTQYG